MSFFFDHIYRPFWSWKNDNCTEYNADTCYIHRISWVEFTMREFWERSQVSRARRMRWGVGNWVNAAMSVGAARPMMNGALNVGLVPNPTSSHVVTSHIFFLLRSIHFFPRSPPRSFFPFSFPFFFHEIFIRNSNFIRGSLIAIDWWLWM